MNVIGLSEIDRSMTALVGGKAAGLGAMVRAGERVPDGFCLTTTAHRWASVPERELTDAYDRLGGGPVAVRSSATAEDLPDASFAGQQATVLNVRGARELVDAVHTCWDSLWTDRAIAYREANGIDHGSVHMAVVVQRMVDARVAGVLFTANPVTGCRTEMVVDAAPGLGTAVVDGSVVPDHYVLDGAGPAVQSGGCLDGARLAELRRAGTRLHTLFGSPQDIEWAVDRDGVLWLLQSRPITTLFPLPPNTGRPPPRCYLEFGHMQGMLQPFTPMGMAAVKLEAAQWLTAYGAAVDPVDGPDWIVDIGGRLYGDLTGLVRGRWTRARLPKALRVYGPRVSAVVERVVADPRFAPAPGPPFPVRAALGVVLRLAPAALVGIARALARPRAARARAFHQVEEVKRRSARPVGPATAEELLRSVEERPRTLFTGPELADIMWPLMAGIIVASAPKPLLRGVVSDAELNTVLGGLPHNVTTEMNLALWRLAEGAAAHRAPLSDTPPAELAALYRGGALPDIGLDVFLERYGHRAAAEIDVGVPRWSEDPAPVFAAIANYLRITDPEQAPDRRFARAAAAAEATLDELAPRARRARPVRGRAAVFCMRRSRELAGLRELGKFAWLYVLDEMRGNLLLAGGELAARGLLDTADDIMFLGLREAREAVRGRDLRDLVAARRAVHERESRRRSVPVAVLSDGTDPEAAAPPGAVRDGTLVGLGAAPGRITARARVVRDPAGAHVDPGEILVAPTTDPGWTPLFMTAGGLVTETGAPLAHGPTVAREYGIPAVICVRDATREIRTGQLITIDGAAGTVSTAPSE